MNTVPSPRYLAATIGAGLLAVLGAWLPWVSKRPVDYMNGDPYYTMELVPGLESGFQYPDHVAVLLAGLAVAVVILSYKSAWRPDAILIALGGLLLLGSGVFLRSYWTTDRYVIEPGLYLLAASGLLLVLLGAGSLLERRYLALTEDGGRPRVG